MAGRIVIELEKVAASYPSVKGSERIAALQELDLTVREGEFTAIIGPSGAGKTTLLRTLTGFVTPAAGRVVVNGTNVARASVGDLRVLRRKVATIYQQYHLVERASALQNVLFGRLGHVHPILSLFGYFPRRDRENAYRALARLGMAERATQRADRLSGGERQRVAVARALVQEPAIILADEPAASLDIALTELLLTMLRTLNRDEGLTVLVNLHDVELAKQYAHRVVALREGRTVFDGPTERLDQTWLESIYERGAETGARSEAA